VATVVVASRRIWTGALPGIDQSRLHDRIANRSGVAPRQHMVVAQDVLQSAAVTSAPSVPATGDGVIVAFENRVVAVSRRRAQLNRADLLVLLPAESRQSTIRMRVRSAL